MDFENTAKPVFGVRVALQSTGSLVTFVCYLDNGRVYTHKRVVSQDEFIKILSGHWPSLYNPKRINYFEEQNIFGGVLVDSITGKTSTYCPALDSLWKIRFSTFPFRTSAENGWAHRLQRPSLAQEKYLYDNYKVAQIDGEFFLDTNFWRITRDVVDSGWIMNYKSLD